MVNVEGSGFSELGGVRLSSPSCKLLFSNKIIQNAIIPNVPAEQSKVAGANGLVAFVLCTLLGTLGIHRFYMGTATLTGIGYILTGGGFGVVVLIDWVVLLINSDISKYENNTKFFMW